MRTKTIPVLAAILATACTLPSGVPVDPPSEPTRSSLEANLRLADEVIVARLNEVRRDPRRDGFQTTSRWLIETSMKGDLLPGAVVGVRLPYAGQLERAAIGDRHLLLLDRELYEREVASHNGVPEAGFTGAGLGLFPVASDEIRVGPEGRNGVALSYIENLLDGH